MDRELHYFVGHQLTPENKADLRNFIESVLKPKNCIPYYAEREVGSQPILMKVCQKIFNADFGIFDVSTSNANVYMEIGIALAFNKPILIIAREGSSLADALLGHSVLRYGNYQDLVEKLEAAFPSLQRHIGGLIDFCRFCNQACEGLTAYPDRNTYLILDKRSLLAHDEWQDLRHAVETRLQTSNLQAISLKENFTGKLLCNIRKRIRSTQFSICHLGELSDANCYIALGLAIGYCRPWLLVSKESDGEKAIPSNLKGFDRLEYPNLCELNQRLENDLQDFLNLFYPQASDREHVTSILTKDPFWFTLSDWIERMRPAPKTGSLAKGRLRIVQVGNQSFLDKFIVTRKGLILGRDSACDIVISHNLVSKEHASVYQQDGEYYLKDLNSTNGTFYDERRLSPGEVVKVALAGKIRIARVERYLVWDEQPLPIDSYFGKAQQTSTGILTLEILLKDEKPPKLATEEIDYSFLLAVTGKANGMYQIQSYYRFGAILNEIAKFAKFPASEYCIAWGTKVIDEEITPLSMGLLESNSVEIVKYKELIRRVLLEKYSVFEENRPGQAVDFRIDRKERNECVFIYATKLDIDQADIKSLNYVSNLHRKNLLLSNLGEVSLQIADAEREMQKLLDSNINQYRSSNTPRQSLQALQELKEKKNEDMKLIQELMSLYEQPFEDLDTLNRKTNEIVSNMQRRQMNVPVVQVQQIIVVPTEKAAATSPIVERAKKAGVQIVNVNNLMRLLQTS